MGVVVFRVHSKSMSAHRVRKHWPDCHYIRTIWHYDNIIIKSVRAPAVRYPQCRIGIIIIIITVLYGDVCLGIASAFTRLRKIA